GTICPPANRSSATVNLGGAATASTTADSAGNYMFNAVANGSYVVMPAKAGFAFTPSSRNVTVSSASVSGIDFTAAPASITVSITSPADGATVPNAFSISATASAGVVGVQFRVDGQAAGAEDTSAPDPRSVTGPPGAHTLTAAARGARGTR